MEEITRIFGHYGVTSILIKTNQTFDEYNGRTLKGEIQIDINAEILLDQLGCIKRQCKKAIKELLIQ